LFLWAAVSGRSLFCWQQKVIENIIVGVIQSECDQQVRAPNNAGTALNGPSWPGAQSLLAGHQGLLIATPEHNGGYTAPPKNALDWMSRPDGFPSGKVAAPISASLGLPGGAKSQLSLQIVLSNLGVHVISESFALGATHQLFDAEGGLKDPMARGRFAASAQHSRR
jgi:hypothetical protein